MQKRTTSVNCSLQQKADWVRKFFSFSLDVEGDTRAGFTIVLLVTKTDSTFIEFFNVGATSNTFPLCFIEAALSLLTRHGYRVDDGQRTLRVVKSLKNR